MQVRALSGAESSARWEKPPQDTQEERATGSSVLKAAWPVAGVQDMFPSHPLLLIKREKMRGFHRASVRSNELTEAFQQKCLGAHPQISALLPVFQLSFCLLLPSRLIAGERCS